jgi:hypothetical protein
VTSAVDFKPKADFDALTVGTSQLAAALDVSKNYVVVLTRQGVLEPLKKPNGTSRRPVRAMRAMPFSR